MASTSKKITTDFFYVIVEFEDGLQIIPNTWLRADMSRAVWPNYTNNKRYDKAVKLLEEPQPTWVEHPVQKIYATTANYEHARKKLKEAEKLSDLNSEAETREFLKKSRKLRAKKIRNDSSNTSDASVSDEGSIIVRMPRVPQKLGKTAKGYTDPEYLTEDPGCLETPKLVEDVSTSAGHNVQHNICEYEQFLLTKEDEADVRAVEAQATSVRPDTQRRTEDFERLVLSKLITLELKMNRIDRQQQEILKQLSHRSAQEIEHDEIDILGELPLKTPEEMALMETKLASNGQYRSLMEKQLFRATSGDVKTSCISVMRKIISNNVAVEYSWHGAKKKNSFSGTHLCRVLMSVMRKAHPDATDSQISGPAKTWLAHAKERMERTDTGKNVK